MPKRIYVGKSKDQIERWRGELSRLKKEAESALGDAKNNYEIKIKELQDKISQGSVMPGDRAD